MSFNAAALVATIRLDGAEKLGRDLNTVRGRLNDTDSAIAKVRAAGKAAFDQTAVGVGAASVAVGVLTQNLFSQGVAYNQLQQTSRAALRTLLGGAEAANAQMDKLDAFARTSPFSKAVFISAQQQLIGFGFEAQKVIPILTAVQDSVAAVGGSNEQIAEIVSILAKIRSSGKLTAEDLNQLGERGLDAATLLGQGFGKSAADIRSEITKGTVDANAAIDVLVDQMGTKFAGAASNVKETFSGTMDRIKAASRDIGAALAEPFVAKNGGGLAVTWGNQVADVMRAVESHVKPFVSILMDAAVPAVNGVTDALDRAGIQVRSWDSSRVSDGLKLIGDNGPAVAAVAGALIGVNSGLLAGLPIVGAFIPKISPLGGILTAIALASPEVRGALGDLLSEMKPLVPVVVELAGVFSNSLNLALPVVADGIRVVAAVAKPLVEIVSAIPAPMLATVAATIAVTSALRSNAPALQGFVDGIRRIADQVAVQSALAAMEGNTGRFSGALGLAGAKATGLMNSLKAAFISNPVGLIILGLSTAAAVLTAAFTAQAEQAKAAREQIDSYRDTLDQATGAVLRATRAEVEKTLADKGALDAAEKLGVNRSTVIDAVMGESKALAIVKQAYKDNAGASGDYLKSGADLRQEAGLLNSVVLEQSGLLKEAEEQTRDEAKAKREAARASSELERSNSRLTEALAIARDVGRDATERLKALKLALDELKVGAKSQAEVTRNLNEQTDRLREVFLATNDAGEKLAGGLVDGAGNIDTATAAGRALFDEVGRLNDQMLDAILLADKDAKARGESGVSMGTAREIAARYQDTLRNLGKEANLSDEQMNGLVSTMLSTPEVVAYAVTDDGSIDANKLRMLDLATQILATPDKAFEVTSDQLPGLMEALRALGVKIETLPDGTVSVKKDDQSIAAVEQAFTNLARTRTAVIRVQQDGSVSYPNGMVASPRAVGGPINGPGSATSDSVLARLSNGEHVWTAAETNALGGHGAMMQLRSAVRAGKFNLPAYADGGAVGLGVRRDVLPAATDVQLRSAAPAPAAATASDVVSASDEPRVLIQFGDIYVPPGYSEAQIRAMFRDELNKAFSRGGLRL